MDFLKGLPWPAGFHKSLIPLDKKSLMDWSWYFADYNIAGWYLVAEFLGQLHTKRRFARGSVMFENNFL